MSDRYRDFAKFQNQYIQKDLYSNNVTSTKDQNSTKHKSKPSLTLNTNSIENLPNKDAYTLTEEDVPIPKPLRPTSKHKSHIDNLRNTEHFRVNSGPYFSQIARNFPQTTKTPNINSEKKIKKQAPSELKIKTSQTLTHILGTNSSESRVQSLILAANQDIEKKKQRLIKEQISTTFQKKGLIHSIRGGPGRSIESMKNKAFQINQITNSNDDYYNLESVSRIKNTPQKLSHIQSILSSPLIDKSPSGKSFKFDSPHLSTNRRLDRLAKQTFQTKTEQSEFQSPKSNLEDIIAEDIDARPSNFNHLKSGGGTSDRQVTDLVSNIQKNTIAKPQITGPSPRQTFNNSHRVTKGSVIINRKSTQFGVFHSRLEDADKRKFDIFLKSPFLEEVKKMKENRFQVPQEKELQTLEDYKIEFPDTHHIENRHMKNIDDLPEDYLEEFRKANPNLQHDEKAEKEFHQKKVGPRAYQLFTSDLPAEMTTMQKPKIAPEIDIASLPISDKELEMQNKNVVGNQAYSLDAQAVFKRAQTQKELSQKFNSMKTRLQEQTGKVPKLGHFKQPSAGGMQSTQRKYESKRWKRIRGLLRKRLHQWSQFGMSIKDIIAHEIVATVPYQKKGSEDFFWSVKAGDWQTVQNRLNRNKFLVYDFDHVKQTALHWAAKRGYTKICEILLKKGAEVDHADITSKTPLYFALTGSHIETVKLLLFYRANPFNSKYKFHELTENSRCLITLGKARQLHTIMQFHDTKGQNQLWEKKAHEIFDADNALNTKGGK